MSEPASEITIRRHYGFLAPSRETAQAAIAEQNAKREEGGLRHPSAPALEFRMPCCGKMYTFATVDDFPEKTLPCECGHQGRWAVFYSEGE